MTEYTIVEPGFEFIEPSSDYLKFLEVCTRTCYKSEDHIKEGSAERLMSKVVKEFEHLSVTEHATCIMDIDCNTTDQAYHRFIEVLEAADPVHRQAISLFALRSNISISGVLRISGNVRMWMELLQSEKLNPGFHDSVQASLNNKWPFFFEPADSRGNLLISVLDDNPLTNIDDLSKDDMLRHMTLTCKLIGDRTMSHQLVRHRLAAYSQESQRYCDYGKKGFQFIIPPAYQGELREEFIQDAVRDYERYIYYRERKIKPEDARAKLPNAAKTEVVTTYTLGVWEHVLESGIDDKFKQVLPRVFG
jgi:hypothetical protein